MTNMNASDGPRTHKPVAITVQTFTHIFGVGRTTAFALMRQGRLERVRINGRTLITMVSAEALIAQKGGE